MKNKLLKIIICILTFALLLSGCTGEGDVTDTQQGIVDLGSDTVTEGGTEKPSDTEAQEKTYVNMWKYSQESGITVRDIVIETGKGGEDIEIIQLTDMHLAYANETDLKDAQILKTYNSRTFGKNGQFLGNALRCLEFGKNADQIVITGDIYDYLTSEVAAQVNKYIFSAYDNVMACLGNHESVKEMGEESKWSQATIESRIATLKESWVNDVYYSSKVLGDKVMLIQMDNGTTGSFWDCQVPLFKADLETARANGYVVLLFYHIPLATYNIDYYATRSSMVGDTTATVRNFATSGSCSTLVGADKEIYDLITTNGDIIKGGFCGHYHSDFYTEIDAQTPDGTSAPIPQYTLIATLYGNGHALRITVK